MAPCHSRDRLAALVAFSEDLRLLRWGPNPASTSALNDVHPQAYLADVLMKLVNLWAASRIDELMPWAWSAGHRIGEPDRAAA